MGCARMPASPEPIAQFQANPRVIHNIANVASSLAVLCHDPKLSPHESVSYGSTARLAGLAAGCFQERIPRRNQANGKQKLNRWVEQVFLKKVDNGVFHCVALTDGDYILLGFQEAGSEGTTQSSLGVASVMLSPPPSPFVDLPYRRPYHVNTQ
jgi:hypothetical protein